MFVAFIFNATSISAAINNEYSNTDPVGDTNLEDAFEESTLLEALAKLIYALGQFFEWILSIIFKMLTGSSDFPWADKIVFNAVPLLDVNFINPDSKSFVGQPTIQGILQNLYATVLAIAVTFFGIVVMITAIRLVISTIASEKAKYKQAIVDWATGLVMLFCMHFFISFIFYLNEQLVIVASKVVTSQLEKSNAVAKVQSSELVNELADSMGDHKWNGINTKDLLTNNKRVVATYINLDSADGSKGLQELLTKDVHIWGDTNIAESDQKNVLNMIIHWAISENVSVEELQKIKNKIRVYQSGNGYNQALSETDIKKMFPIEKERELFEESLYTYKLTGTGIVTASISGGVLKDDVNGSTYHLSSGAGMLGKSYNGAGNFVTEFFWTDVLSDLIRLKASSDTANGVYQEASGESKRLISDLATYFKQNAAEKTFRDTNITGLKNTGNINIENMIMYAILVVQSLILFIAYIKRLFYVIMLAMMAPIVVVYDFFQRFGK